MLLTLTLTLRANSVQTMQRQEPDAANPNAAESMVKISIQNPPHAVQQPQPNAPNPNTAESMVKNAHRTLPGGLVGRVAFTVQAYLC
jgi:hypothetical protein